MNELSSLSSLGLELPSPAYLMGSILFGVIGYVAFRRGRKAERPELIWAGVALMAYPYVVHKLGCFGLLGLFCAAGSMPSGIEPSHRTRRNKPSTSATGPAPLS